MMYDTIYDVGIELQKYLEARTDSVVEIKEVLACFTTDAISSCAFGIDAKSLENPDSEYRKYGRMVFELPVKIIISGIVRFVAPWLDKYVTVRTTHSVESVSSYHWRTQDADPAAIELVPVRASYAVSETSEYECGMPPPTIRIVCSQGRQGGHIRLILQYSRPCGS